MRPFLLVLSAPSGCGKTTIARRLLEQRPGLAYSVSATTRPPRAGERDGQSYHFLSPEAFERRVRAGDFLEWAEYAGHRYGTLRS
ncbi:MAG TPA: guanylate kinase, partial [Gemmatimonadales bacterium]|nr:guanylate kinase [Gemmatimonadales bacterium]